MNVALNPGAFKARMYVDYNAVEHNKINDEGNMQVMFFSDFHLKLLSAVVDRFMVLHIIAYCSTVYCNTDIIITGYFTCGRPT